jgi:hypothetical protein
VIGELRREIATGNRGGSGEVIDLLPASRRN